MTYIEAKDLFGAYRIVPKKGGSERGEFLKKFSEKTGKPIKYIAFKLTGVPTTDLYAFDKKCEEYAKSGKPYSKCFYGCLK